MSAGARCAHAALRMCLLPSPAATADSISYDELACACSAAAAATAHWPCGGAAAAALGASAAAGLPAAAAFSAASFARYSAAASGAQTGWGEVGGRVSCARTASRWGGRSTRMVEERPTPHSLEVNALTLCHHRLVLALDALLRALARVHVDVILQGSGRSECKTVSTGTPEACASCKARGGNTRGAARRQPAPQHWYGWVTLRAVNPL